MLKYVGLVLVIWHIEMTMENSPNSLIFSWFRNRALSGIYVLSQGIHITFEL